MTTKTADISPTEFGPRIRLDGSTCISIGTAVSSRLDCRESPLPPPNTFRCNNDRWTQYRTVVVWRRVRNVFCPETSDRRKKKSKTLSNGGVLEEAGGGVSKSGQSFCYEYTYGAMHAGETSGVSTRHTEGGGREPLRAYGPSCNIDRHRSLMYHFLHAHRTKYFFHDGSFDENRTRPCCKQIANDASGQSIEKRHTVCNTSPRAYGVCGRTF